MQEKNNNNVIIAKSLKKIIIKNSSMKSYILLHGTTINLMWIQSVQMTIQTKYISFGWYYSMKSKWCNDTVTGQQALYYWKSLLKNDVIKTIHNNYYIKSRDFISVVAKTKKSNKQQQRRSTRAIIHTVTYYSPKSLLPRSASLSVSPLKPPTS